MTAAPNLQIAIDDALRRASLPVGQAGAAVVLLPNEPPAPPASFFVGDDGD